MLGKNHSRTSRHVLGTDNPITDTQHMTNHPHHDRHPGGDDPVPRHRRQPEDHDAEKGVRNSNQCQQDGEQD
ncbi:hypothetical protein SDC9_163503 [bioreactor metagenome]|uniref:Uncharacterized protein n=1 Tax=bioreactor metagenome TaxID=1076179 RepID=A0A645FP08_9ZZZZ